MYTQNKPEARELIQLLQDALDDVMTWDAHNDDVLNSEINDIQEAIKKMEERIV